MSGGKGKSHGGKGSGAKIGGDGKTQVSHSAKAGLQVSLDLLSGVPVSQSHVAISRRRSYQRARPSRVLERQQQTPSIRVGPAL
jgi:hypothetical protein